MVNAGDDEKRVYFDTSDKTFKERYHHHTHRILMMNATLNVSKYIWQLNRNKKKSLILNRKLLEKYSVIQKVITVYLV